MSFLGALSVIFPIPYAIFIYLMGASTSFDPLITALAAGLGSALGELSGYGLGYIGKRVVSVKYEGRLRAFVKLFDRYGPLAIFLFALTPLPDDLLFIPLGLLRYDLLKTFVSSLIGKFLMSLVLAYGGRFSLGFLREIYGTGVGWIGALITASVLLIVIIAIMKIDWEGVVERHLAKAM